MAIVSAIVGAVTAVAGWIGGLGVIGSALLKAAVGIGISLLGQSFAGKPQEPTFSINGTIQGGGDVPRSFILGRSATAGSLVWVNTWGNDGDSKNAYLTYVIALSDMPVQALRLMFVNGEPVSMTGADSPYGRAVPEYRKDGKDNLWWKFYDGTQTVADPHLVGRCSNHARRWTSDRVGYGVAYVIVTALVSKNMFSGLPSFKFELDGIKLYDISKDSTMGGTGTHRRSDPATWGGDGDHLPAVQLYNVMNGIKYQNKWLYGLQDITPARFPAANWIKQINKCRKPISGASGMEPTYRAGGEIPIDAPISSAIDALLTTCQGRVSEVGGIYDIKLGEPDAPVTTITDGDIISLNEQTFTPFFGLADSINGISAVYPSPADGWVPKSAPPIYRTDLEAKHGNRRLMSDVPLDLVPYPEQVQRLMKSALLEAQRARRHTFVLPPKFWAYFTPGEYIVWNSVRNGYVNKIFRVDGAADKANFDILVDITEVDPSDYDWHSSTDYRPQIDGDIGVIRPEPMPIVSFGALPAIVQDAEGNNRRCGIRLFWDGAVNGVDFVQYEVRKTETLVIVDIGSTNEVARASIIIAPGTLMPNQSFQVRGKYGTFDGGATFLWSNWIEVITDDIRLGALDLYPFDVGNFNKDLVQLWADQADNIRFMADEVDRVSTSLSDLTSDASIQRQGIRESVTAEIGQSRAEYTRLILVEASAREAIATKVETLEAEVGDNIANLLIFAQTTATELTALSQTVTTTQAQVGNISANGYFQVKSEANQGGSLSRISLTVSATAGGAPSQGALFIEAISGGKSRIIMDADSVIMTSGSARASPFAFQNGVLTLTAARIATVTFDVIQSSNGKLIMRGSGNLADIRLFS